MTWSRVVSWQSEGAGSRSPAHNSSLSALAKGFPLSHSFNDCQRKPGSQCAVRVAVDCTGTPKHRRVASSMQLPTTLPSSRPSRSNQLTRGESIDYVVPDDRLETGMTALARVGPEPSCRALVRACFRSSFRVEARVKAGPRVDGLGLPGGALSGRMFRRFALIIAQPPSLRRTLPPEKSNILAGSQLVSAARRHPPGRLQSRSCSACAQTPTP